MARRSIGRVEQHRRYESQPASTHRPTALAPAGSRSRPPVRRSTLRPSGGGRATAGFDKSDKGRINLYALALRSNRRSSARRRPPAVIGPSTAVLPDHGRPALYPAWAAAAAQGRADPTRGTHRVIGRQMMPATSCAACRQANSRSELIR